MKRITVIVVGLILVVQTAVASDIIAGRMNDAWSYDITGETWSELVPPGAVPPVLEFPSGVYDPFNDRMLIFGSPYGGPIEYGIWSYDCATELWSQVTLSGGSLPCPVTGLNAVHLDEPNRRAVVVSAGYGVYTFDLDTDTITKIDGTDWPASAPTAGAMSAYAFDSLRQRILCYGGRTMEAPATVLEDLWVCDTSTTATGPRWWQVPRGAVWPGPLWEVAATIDPVRDRMILYGGRRNMIYDSRIIYQDSTFELNLATEAWTTVTVTRAPGRRGYNAECWDSLRNRVWIYGGIFHETTAYIATFGDLWSLAPSIPDWGEAMPRGATPVTRRNPAMAYDSLRDRILVFGGQHVLISGVEVKAGIKLPRNGASISGNKVLVMAEITSGSASLVRDVRFQYRTSAFGADGEAVEPGPWIDIPPTEPVNHPNPDSTAPYFVHWDVSSMGTVRVDIQAIATGTNDVADPVPAVSTVLIDPGSADSSNSSGGDEPVALAHASVGTTLDVGTASRTSSANVFVRVNGQDMACEADVAVQCRAIPSGARSVDAIECAFDVATTASVSGQLVPITLACVYPDTDGDGIVDGTTIPELELCLCTVSGLVVTPVPGSYVDPLNDAVRAEVSAGGTFGIYRAALTGVVDWSLYD